MARTLTVVFGSGKEFDFTVEDSELAAVTEDAAWRWFDREYAELDCQVGEPPALQRPEVLAGRLSKS